MKKAARKSFSYWECLRLVRKNGSFPPLEASNEFDPRPYQSAIYDLSADGLPYIPVVSRFSLREYEVRSPWHQHKDCIECIFCMRGDMKYESEGRIFGIRPLSVFVSRPTELHRQVSDGRKVVYSAIKFSTVRKDWLSSGFSTSEYEWAMKRLKGMPRSFAGGKVVENDLRELLNAIQMKGMSVGERTFRVKVASSLLLLDMIDEACNGPPLAKDVVTEIIHEMSVHPEKRFSTDELVARLRLSPTGVLNAFKSATGLSPHAYQLKCCIDRAKEFLGKGEIVESVAARLGFASRQHFSATFKRFAGMSPRTWRERHMKTQM